MIHKLKKILLSIKLFSHVITELPLRDYQTGPANALIDSVLSQKGIEYLWVFPRQSGKDEAVAQTLAFLLTLFHRVEASMIHVYPTFQQTSTGVMRLENRLENKLTSGQAWSKSKPTRRGLGLAQCAFFSAHPQAKSEGATANLLLIINEVQDCDEAIIDRRFTPMRASANATALYVGTVRTTADYLWRIKSRLEKLEAIDGIKRVFITTADQVGVENPAYAQFVHNQIQLKGRQHPAIRTEFFNEPVDVAAGLFPKRRLALMRGSHPRQRQPIPGQIAIILIDVGGQDEAATHTFADLSNPGRDYTVATVVSAIPQDEGSPYYHALDLFLDHGSRHFQDVPGQPSLFKRLCAYIEHWQPAAIICDSTGVGQGITDALIEEHPEHVFGFDFAKSHGKARLGNDFLALVETGRFKYFAEELDGSDAWWFFTQAEHCGYELAEGVAIERGLRWEVNPAAKIVVNGESVFVHDDRLLSAALIAEADRLHREGHLFFSTGQSAVIRQERRVDEW